MFAYFTLAIEGRGLEERVRFDEHFGDFLDATPSRVPDAIQVVHVREVRQDPCDVLHDIGVGQLNAAHKMPPHELAE